MAQSYAMGTQADLSHLFHVSAAPALQPDPPHRNTCWYCSQDPRHPETTVAKKIRWENPGLHSPWAFQVSRCYQNLHPHPSWSIPSPVSQLFELQGLGLLQWTSCTSHNTWFHCLYSTICHACSQPSVSQASTTRMWKHPPWCHSSSQGLRGKDKRYMCQVFPRWRVLVCLKPFQFMFARDISIIASFWHGSGSQLWSTIFLQLRVVLVGKGHHFLFP